MIEHATILFYSPFNQRSRDTESLMLAFRRQGHRVISLSLQEGKSIHPFLNANGIETHSYVVSTGLAWWRHLRQLLFFVRFCFANNVDIVYSHLESANFIASIGQYFIRANVFLCRHHHDQYAMTGNDRALSYRITYWLAKKIIVVSAATKKYMVENENVSPEKIININLAYDFNLYPKPDQNSIRRLKDNLVTTTVLITVGQLTPLKRPDESIRLLHKMIEDGWDAKLLLLGKGEMEKELRQLTLDLLLEKQVIFTGYVDNVLDYLGASTYLIHPSVSEASCVAVKEAGLMGVPAIVCSGVGDFDDYIQPGINSFAVDQHNFVVEAFSLLKATGSQQRAAMGQQLRADVLKLFDINNVLPQYDALNVHHD